MPHATAAPSAELRLPSLSVQLQVSTTTCHGIMKLPRIPAPWLAAIFCCVLVVSTSGQTSTSLSMLETDSLAKEAREMLEAGTKGDAELIIKKTHPIILKFYTSQESFEQSTRTALKGLKGSMTFEDLSVGEISEIHPHGKDEICFVPTAFVATVNGKRVQNRGFLFAIREKGKGEWRFLDAAFLRKDSSLLWRVFPDLPKDITLPPNRVEILP